MTPHATPGPRGRRRRSESRQRAGRARLVVAVGVLAVGVVAGLVGVRAGWWSPDGGGVVLGVPRDDPVPDWQPAAAVFDGVVTPDGAPDDGSDDGSGGGAAAAVTELLAGPLADGALGGRVGAVVVDLASGTEVFAEGADVAQMPASTAKLLTGTAALTSIGPEHTFTTAVTAAGPLENGVALALVGGGDPMLGTGEGAAVTPLADLAEATAEALAAAEVDTVALTYDESMFTGPDVDPDWEPGYVSSGVVAPTSALTLDGGRHDPEAPARTTDPAASTAAEFAALLGDAGVEVVGAPEQVDGAAAGTEVATVRSIPLAGVVEHMLDVSDNDVAEVLMRHVALARDLPATSDDGSAAVLAALTDLGLDVTAVTLADGSGLSRASAIPASVLGDLLATAAAPEHPELRASITGLPVAGFTGTLADRWADADGAGVVRAKTGTLTGTSGLAGVVETTDGATLAFAVLADDVTDTIAARAALDDVAGALSTCGCSVP